MLHLGSTAGLGIQVSSCLLQRPCRNSLPQRTCNREIPGACCATAGECKVIPSVPGLCKKEFVNQIFQESWGNQLHHKTAVWKRALTVLPSLPEHPPLSELKSGNQLDPECVIRTNQVDSSAAKAGALLCFVHLCM